MKLRVRILDQRIRQLAVELCDIQFGFRKGRSTTIDTICLANISERKENIYIKILYFLIWKRRATRYKAT